MNISKIKAAASALLLIASSSTMALPVTINDLYEGSDSHGHGDVIGNNTKFNITGMEVDLVGTILSVTINTQFPQFGLGTYTSLTNTVLSGGQGIGFGDLFLSSTGWDPFGSAPYASDDHSNGTIWDFGVSLGDRWDSASSSALYSLNAVTGNPDAYLSEDFLSSGTFRDGQEVAVNTAQAVLETNSTTFGVGTGQVLFTLDIAGTALENADAIGLHWAMTCGNDTIEGEYTNVPEPSTLAIMFLGLLCIGSAVVRRRRFDALA